MRNQFIVLLLSLAVLGGCAKNRTKETSQPSMSPDRMVAYDFVNILAQVDGYHPDYATLQMMWPETGFGMMLQQVLVEANYNVQMVESVSGDNFMDYSTSPADDSSQTYSLSVGRVSMERNYIAEGNEVRPNSELLIDGVDVSQITLHDAEPFSIHIPPATQAKTAEVPVVVEPVALANEMDESDMEIPGTTDVEDSVAQVGAMEDDAMMNTPTFSVLVNGEEVPRSYSEGEKLVFTLQAQRHMRISCYFQDPDAKIMRMYPNSFATNATVLAGETVHIPATDQWSIEASKAGFQDEVMCVSVALEHEPALARFDASPDFELLAYNSLDELLINLSAAIGIDPESQRVSINVQ